MKFESFTADDARKLVFEATLLREATREIFGIIASNAKNGESHAMIYLDSVSEERQPRLKTLFEQNKTNPESLNPLIEIVTEKKFKCRKYEDPCYDGSKVTYRHVIEVDWSPNTNKES